MTGNEADVFGNEAEAVILAASIDDVAAANITSFLDDGGSDGAVLIG